MSNFKVGEKVVCINDTNITIAFELKKGEIYTVREVFRGIDLKGDIVEGLTLNEVINGNCSLGREIGYTSDRFRKLDQQFAENVIKNLIETSQPVEI